MFFKKYIFSHFIDQNGNSINREKNMQINWWLKKKIIRCSPGCVGWNLAKHQWSTTCSKVSGKDIAWLTACLIERKSVWHLPPPPNDLEITTSTKNSEENHRIVSRSFYSRSSSKCVSMPSAPGTEQMSLAFRKVLHLLTRQQWPPSSFCIWEGGDTAQFLHH